MDTARLQQALDDVFDQALVYPAYLRYLFRRCVEADVQTAVSAGIWRRSLDDRLIDYDTGKDLDGYVWGVRWQVLYPGAKVVPGSKRAQRWADALGIDFHEVRIQANGHNITLVFSYIQVTQLPLGYERP